jgi:hypothetical protein
MPNWLPLALSSTGTYSTYRIPYVRTVPTYNIITHVFHIYLPIYINPYIFTHTQCSVQVSLLCAIMYVSFNLYIHTHTHTHTHTQCSVQVSLLCAGAQVRHMAVLGRDSGKHHTLYTIYTYTHINYHIHYILIHTTYYILHACILMHTYYYIHTNTYYKYILIHTY